MSFDQDRLASNLAQIEAIETVILSIIEDGAQSYTLDTGQSRQTVTKLTLPALRQMRTDLVIEYNTLARRISGVQLLLRSFQ
ncbi:hypothetical protein KAR91_45815 [Candidatus Pacearchaeota archaeon]|nr:hypothetical protein [Candidatus Pacearchaeota archaeon]